MTEQEKPEQVCACGCARVSHGWDDGGKVWRACFKCWSCRHYIPAEPPAAPRIVAPLDGKSAEVTQEGMDELLSQFRAASDSPPAGIAHETQGYPSRSNIGTASQLGPDSPPAAVCSRQSHLDANCRVHSTAPAQPMSARGEIIGGGESAEWEQNQAVNRCDAPPLRNEPPIAQPNARKPQAQRHPTKSEIKEWLALFPCRVTDLIASDAYTRRKCMEAMAVLLIKYQGAERDNSELRRELKVAAHRTAALEQERAELRGRLGEVIAAHDKQVPRIAELEAALRKLLTATYNILSGNSICNATQAKVQQADLRALNDADREARAALGKGEK